MVLFTKEHFEGIYSGGMRESMVLFIKEQFEGTNSGGMRELKPN